VERLCTKVIQSLRVDVAGLLSLMVCRSEFIDIGAN